MSQTRWINSEGLDSQDTLQEQIDKIMEILGTGYQEGQNNTLSIGGKSDIKSILKQLNDTFTYGDADYGYIIDQLEQIQKVINTQDLETFENVFQNIFHYDLSSDFNDILERFKRIFIQENQNQLMKYMIKDQKYNFQYNNIKVCCISNFDIFKIAFQINNVMFSLVANIKDKVQKQNSFEEMNIKQLQLRLDQSKYSFNILQFRKGIIYCIFNDQQFQELYTGNYFLENYNYEQNNVEFILDAYNIENDIFRNITNVDQFKMIIMNLNTRNIGFSKLFSLKKCILLNCDMEENVSENVIVKEILNSNIKITSQNPITMKFQFIINSNIDLNGVKSLEQIDQEKIGLIYRSGIEQKLINQGNVIVENTFNNFLVYKSIWDLQIVNYDENEYWYPIQRYSNEIGVFVKFILEENAYINNSKINVLEWNDQEKSRRIQNQFQFNTGIIIQNNHNIVFKDNEFQRIIPDYANGAISFNTIFYDVDIELHDLLVGTNFDVSINTLVNNQ